MSTVSTSAAAVQSDTVRALTAVLREEPDDRTVHAALVDALQEQGKSRLAAVRVANAVAREGAESLQHRIARTLVGDDGARGRKARAAIRSAATGATSQTEITVVVGDAAPVLTGEAGHSTFKGGGRCNNPGAARRAGYKVEYHRSTLEITVGAGWVARRCEGYDRFAAAYRDPAAAVERHRGELARTAGEDPAKVVTVTFARGPWAAGEKTTRAAFNWWREAEVARLSESLPAPTATPEPEAADAVATV